MSLPYILLPRFRVSRFVLKYLTSAFLVVTFACSAQLWLYLLPENILHPLLVVPVTKSAALIWFWRLSAFFALRSLVGHSVGTMCFVCRNVVTVASVCRMLRNRPRRVAFSSTSDHLRLCRYSKLSRASRRSASGLISLSFVNLIASSMRSFYFLFVSVVHPFPKSVEGCLGICLLPSS